MKTLVGLFVRRPVFTWSLIIAVVVAGLASLRGLGLERYPNVDIPVVSVSVQADGLSASQVESEITTKLEAAISGISALERIDSSSQDGACFVVAQFQLSKDGALAAQEIRDKLGRLAAEFPPSARAPQVELYNPNSAPVMLVALTSKTLALRELTELGQQRLRNQLQTIKGVAEIRTLGGSKRNYRIELRTDKLDAAGITAEEVEASLARENLDAPGAVEMRGGTRFAVRAGSRAQTFSELGAVTLATRGNAPVRLLDVADLVDGETAPTSIVRLSGVDGVVVAILKQAGANTLEVTKAVRARVDAIASDPTWRDVQVRVVRDEGTYVEAQVHAVYEHLIVGSLLAAIVVLAFLRDVRATLIAALAIPSSVVGTFALIKVLGLSLNMLTLLGLTLAVGIVIDDAIVVLENIVRVARERQLNAYEAAIAATQEIGLAVLATTLSLVAVFLPVAFMGGIVGRFLASFGWTMSVSILLSMAVAFTLTPMLCARWLKLQPGGQSSAEPAHQHAHPAGWLERKYVQLLAWCMQRRGLVVGAVLFSLAAIVPLAVAIPKTFLPAEDEGRFSVYVRLPEASNVEATALEAERLARALRASSQVETTLVMAGAAAGDASGRGGNEASVYVQLAPGASQAEWMDNTRKLLAAGELQPDTFAMVGSVSDLNGEGPEGAAVQYVLTGPDIRVLESASAALLQSARNLAIVRDPGSNQTRAGTELSLLPLREHANALGITQAQISATLAVATQAGKEIGVLRDPQDELKSASPVSLVLSAEGRLSDQIRTLSVRGTDARLIPLLELTAPQQRATTPVLRRTNRERQLTVFMNIAAGSSEDAAVAVLDNTLAQQHLSAEYHGQVIGNAAEMKRTQNAFAAAIALSFNFMYLILAAQFESFWLPLAILLALPLSLPFALAALLAGGQSLNLFSLLGFLVLFGIVKKNSILQIDHMLALQRAGLPRAEAILQANAHRLRPILMTTIAFVAGLLPLVFSRGLGAGTNHAISIGVAGGQTLSLLLTLLATPVVYSLFDDLRLAYRKWQNVEARAESSNALE